MIYLFGSFLFNDNYGDVIQAKAWVNFYKRNNFKIKFICHQHAAKSSQKWLLLNQDEIIFLDQFKKVDNFSNNDYLHLYGGGYLNKYWADYYIPTILEAQKNNIKIYTTGIQVDDYFIHKAKDFDLLIKYLTVRDNISVSLLGIRDKKRIIDDSFGYFLSRKDFYDSYFLKPKLYKDKKVLLQLSLNDYTHDNEIEIAKKKYKEFVLFLLNKNYKITFSSSFSNPPHHIIESKRLVKELGIRSDFMYTNTMEMDLELPESYEFIVVNSFHTYLLAIAKYNCPVFFLALNKYYLQKTQGLLDYKLITSGRLITDLNDIKSIIKKANRGKSIPRKRISDNCLKFLYTEKLVLKFIKSNASI